MDRALIEPVGHTAIGSPLTLAAWPILDDITMAAQGFPFRQTEDLALSPQNNNSQPLTLRQRVAPIALLNRFASLFSILVSVRIL
jgi:hypothetical protein